MARIIRIMSLCSLCLFAWHSSAADAGEPWDQLSMVERTLLDRILQKWATWVPARKEEGTAPLMNFTELYQGLSPGEIELLERIRAIDPREAFGFVGDFLGKKQDPVRFRRIEGQTLKGARSGEIIPPQYLPENVYSAYLRMMNAMQQDLGKRLLIESGYRSPAYQLYTFAFFTPNHGYSLVETGGWVAIPGYSEHGAPHQQAIDFINEEGVNGEEVPEQFEALPEYAWLQKNAKDYGFVLSYPRGKPGIVFEPWHWSYRPESGTEASAPQETETSKTAFPDQPSAV